MTDDNTTTMTTDNLVKRVEALEIGKQYTVDRDEIQRIQMEHLQQLRMIRNALLLESTATGNNENGSVVRQTKEIEDLKLENDMLKVQVEKQNYRIQHLVTVVEELLTKAQNPHK